MIAAAAILAKPNAQKRNWAIMAGALIPDISIYVMSAWAIATGRMNRELWEVTYWQDPWQTLGAITNSVPLALLVLALSLWRKWPWLTALAFALLIHAALDFPVHADDAHRHFWPISDWRFHSPVSYWDSDHHGFWGGLSDVSVLFAGIAILWARFKALWVRILLAALAILGIAYTAMLFSFLWG